MNIALRQPDGGLIWPVQRAMKRYENGAEDGIYADDVFLRDAAGKSEI